MNSLSKETQQKFCGFHSNIVQFDENYLRIYKVYTSKKQQCILPQTSTVKVYNYCSEYTGRPGILHSHVGHEYACLIAQATASP